MATAIPLAAVHAALGARFLEEDGRQWVADYGAPEAGHRAARAGVGLFDLSGRGLLEVQGPDRAPWLHNLLTNDVKALRPGQGCHAAFLTAHGKVRAMLHLLALPEAFLIECEPSLAATLPAALLRYRITERVTLTDRTAELGLLSLQGPNTQALVTAWAGAEAWPMAELDHTERRIQGIPVRLIRRRVASDPGLHCLIPTAHLAAVWQHLQAAGGPFGLAPCGMTALESLRIEAGVPRYGRDVDETTVLPEAGLEGIVSRTKGCYLGQELVVRVRDRGQLTRRLCHLALEGPRGAAHGDAVIAGDRPVGTITSSAVSPTSSRPFALAYLHRDVAAAGAAVTVQMASGPCPAVVLRPCG